ncbi:MAG: FAD-dependent oxidoreductase [Acidimicrobiia bacterium]
MISGLPETWDEVADVVIVGSGGAALTAATLAADGGASVIVLEKDSMIGGTTAVSGGVIWIPANHHMAEAGLEDSIEEGVEYASRLAAGSDHDPALLRAVLKAAPEMLAYLESKTPVKMGMLAYFPDYYFAYDVPGKKGGGRSLEPIPYPVGIELPDWVDKLASRTTLMSLGATTTLAEDLGMAPSTPEEIAARVAGDVRSKGAALIAMLTKGLLERGVSLRLSSPASELVMNDGAVVGVAVGGNGGSRRLIGARKGVVLACGGFEWNKEMVRAHIGHDIFPVTPPNNVGDGLVMAQEAGADLGNLRSFWGTGAMFDPTITRDGELVPQFDCARGMAGTIVVNKLGHRFVNESVPYNDFPKAFATFDPAALDFPNHPPAWMIFTEDIRRQLVILSSQPDQPAPAWMITAATIGELAERIGVPAENLERTVARFNEYAAEGRDPDFGRPLGFPGSQLGPIGEAPYYAVQILPGTLGTNGGPRVTTDAQVKSARGGVVPGLYAAGNTMANAFGWAYPSGGGTICNAMTTGYLAGRHVAEQPARPIER